MRPPAPHGPLITLLRGSTRLAGWVLAMFLTTIVASVACADHDLADAGIGQHQSHMPAPGDSGAGGSGSSAHSYGQCCHSGGSHVPALPTIVAVLPISSLACISFTDEPTRPSAIVQRELRPPIL